MNDLQKQMEENLISEYLNAKTYEDWNPPDGKHTVLIYGYKDGVSKKNNKRWWKLECRMLDPNPELEGKEFGIWFSQAAPIPILKSAVNTLARWEVNDIHEAIQTLKDSVGKTINIQTKTNKKGFTNHRILSVVPDVPTT